jgi:hypothetical protein
MSPPAFLDKLAPGLRVCIYDYVFGSSKAIKPKNSTASLGISNRLLATSGRARANEILVDCSILATNKIIFQEATQLLYHNKVIRATFLELQQLLRHAYFSTNVERVEIADCVNYDNWGDLEICPDILKMLQRLPRIRSVVMLSDCLSGVLPRTEDLSGGPGRPYIQCWVGLHEEIAAMEASGKLPEFRDQGLSGSVSLADADRLQIIKEYIRTTLYSRLGETPQSKLWVGLSEPQTLHLRHLKPGDDPGTLCWATEYLAANVASFRCNHDRHQWHWRHEIDVQHWAEADGGTHLIEPIIAQQKLAFAGLPNSSYFCEPVRKSSLLDTNIVERHITFTCVEKLATDERSGQVGSPEFVPLAHLSIAIGMNPPFLGLPTDANYLQELDKWAYDYLKRHLLVSGWADPDMLRGIGLADMRRSLSLLIRDTSSLDRIDTDTPEDLDADLSVPLAWNWGWQYARICAEQHEAGQEVEAGSDLEEEGSESASESEWEE